MNLNKFGSTSKVKEIGHFANIHLSKLKIREIINLLRIIKVLRFKHQTKVIKSKNPAVLSELRK